uniref:Uncharacterized protein n=1 Tax=Globisporangium ultimum (strain ATCC 200006 / CBS 805.95 / DAOM BR144) TaxID=431595 RepID=K3WMK7_GLOUD
MTAAGHRSRSKSHYHRSGKIKRSSVKTSAYHSSPYAVTRKDTSASHVPKQAGKKAPPQDLIEISSSSSSMSASDQKEE